MGQRHCIEWEILPKLTFEEPNKLMATLYGDGDAFLFETYNENMQEEETEPLDAIVYPQSQFTVRLFKDKLSRVIAILRLPDAKQDEDCLFIGIRFGNETEPPLYRAIYTTVGGGCSLCSMDAALQKKDLSLAPVKPEKQIEALVQSLEPAM